MMISVIRHHQTSQTDTFLVKWKCLKTTLSLIIWEMDTSVQIKTKLGEQAKRPKEKNLNFLTNIRSQ